MGRKGRETPLPPRNKFLVTASSGRVCHYTTDNNWARLIERENDNEYRKSSNKSPRRLLLLLHRVFVLLRRNNMTIIIHFHTYLLTYLPDSWR